MVHFDCRGFDGGWSSVAQDRDTCSYHGGMMLQSMHRCEMTGYLGRGMPQAIVVGKFSELRLSRAVDDLRCNRGRCSRQEWNVVH